MAADTNLGNAAGGLVIDDATLRTTGANMISARTVELAGRQGTRYRGRRQADAFRHGLGCGRAGEGGRGTLVLNGTNSYAGDTVVKAGTLVYNTENIPGNLLLYDNGVAVFDQAVAGTFTGWVQQSGGVVIKQGAGE